MTFVGYQALPANTRSAINKVVDVAMEDVKVSIVPTATSIGGVHFRDEGVTIAGNLAVFGWNASMYLNVDTFDGVTAEADMDPINILNILKVTGAGTDPAPKMSLRISTSDVPVAYIFSQGPIFSANPRAKSGYRRTRNALQFQERSRNCLNN